MTNPLYFMPEMSNFQKRIKKNMRFMYLAIIVAILATTFSPIVGIAQPHTKKKTAKLVPLTIPKDTTAPEVQWASRVVSVSSQLKPRGPYSAFQILGKPNILSLAGDDNPCAWAAGNDGKDAKPEDTAKIRVGFDTPVWAQQIAVAENLNPGAITTIIVYDGKGYLDTIYQAKPERLPETWRMLNVFFTPKFKISEVQLVLAVGAVLGWNEIDAIALATTTDTIRPEINIAPGAPMNIAPENLGTRINSAYNEICPIISPDGKTLYFCNTNNPQNIDGLKADIWYSDVQKDGFFGEAINIGRPLNNASYNYACSISPDGNTLLLGNVYDADGKTTPGVSMSQRQGGEWSFPEKLEIDGFAQRGRYTNFCLAADGKTLLLAMESDETYGASDIYVSFVKPDGKWTALKNIGHDVNTAGMESTVFLASDNATLYFSSEGHNGYGSNDLFVTRRLDSTWLHWSEPQNLGPSINSDKWDGYFSVPASGEYAYFASEKNSFGGNDIFRIALPLALRPHPVALISGKVLDAKTHKPVKADIHYEILPAGNEVGIARSNSEDGMYKISIPAGELYGFRAEADGYLPVNENVDTKKLQFYQELKRDLLLVPIEEGQTVRINNIFFETGKWDLKPESLAELRRLSEFMQKNSGVRIAIFGHTDNAGSPETNKELSLKRAQSVVNFLNSEKIAPTRMTVKGLGETKPEAPNDTEEGRQKNRRVEFRIEKK